MAERLNVRFTAQVNHPNSDSVRWLFGDQLGPHFVDTDDQRVVLVESRSVFSRKRFHRAKAHLVLSAMRHRAAELGPACRYLRTDTYREAMAILRADTTEPLTVVHPTSRPALALVQSWDDVEVRPARGFATPMEDFARWAGGRGGRRLLMEDFYQDARRRLGVLMDGPEPAGGQWNLDRDNREPPPRQARGRTGALIAPEPVWPVEDEIDQQVRADLDRWERDGDVAFLGQDGPRRFAASRAEAVEAMSDFVSNRLPVFGPYEDAVLSGDAWMAHSLLSAPLNLGLLDPIEVVEAAEQAYRDGAAPLASVEGFVRQIIGWRDYVWHLYWHLGEEYRSRNALQAHGKIPRWFAELDPSGTDAACLSATLARVQEHGWVHHIPRLMVLGNYALQQGWDPAAVTDWFHRAFVDGYDWVMVPNVVGMSQHADGGVLATKPYAAGGAYLNRMTDHCASCRFSPSVRVGERACPFTAGYWLFLHRNRERLAGNHRMRPALRGLDRLRDLDELLAEHGLDGGSGG